jgi:hypothetical protein
LQIAEITVHLPPGGLSFFQSRDILLHSGEPDPLSGNEIFYQLGCVVF